MACMETECRKCGWFMIDNTWHKVCPKCQSKALLRFCDEVPDPKYTEEVEEYERDNESE